MWLRVSAVSGLLFEKQGTLVARPRASCPSDLEYRNTYAISAPANVTSLSNGYYHTQLGGFETPTTELVIEYFAPSNLSLTSLVCG